MHINHNDEDNLSAGEAEMKGKAYSALSAEDLEILRGRGVSKQWEMGQDPESYDYSTQASQSVHGFQWESALTPCDDLGSV